MSGLDDTQTTHSAECWKWHSECAGREVERLRAENERLRSHLRMIRSAAIALGRSRDITASEVVRWADQALGDDQ